VLCADWATMDLCATALAQRKLPHRVRKRSGDYQPGADAWTPRGGATRRGAHACAGRGREGSGAGVLCGGYAGYAEVGDGGGW
jgi:hypothetical protein